MTIYTFRLIVRPQYGVGFHVFHEILIKYPNSRIIEQKLDEFNSPDYNELFLGFRNSMHYAGHVTLVEGWDFHTGHRWNVKPLYTDTYNSA